MAQYGKKYDGPESRLYLNIGATPAPFKGAADLFSGTFKPPTCPSCKTPLSFKLWLETDKVEFNNQGQVVSRTPLEPEKYYYSGAIRLAIEGDQPIAPADGKARSYTPHGRALNAPFVSGNAAADRDAREVEQLAAAEEARQFEAFKRQQAEQQREAEDRMGESQPDYHRSDDPSRQVRYGDD